MRNTCESYSTSKFKFNVIEFSFRCILTISIFDRVAISSFVFLNQNVLLLLSPLYEHTHPLPHNQVLFENTDQDIIIATLSNHPPLISTPSIPDSRVYPDIP